MDLMGLHHLARHHEMTHKRYQPVTINGKVVLKQIFIVEKKQEISLEVTPRLEERNVITVAEEKANDLPVRPPRRAKRP